MMFRFFCVLCCGNNNGIEIIFWSVLCVLRSSMLSDCFTPQYLEEEESSAGREEASIQLELGLISNVSGSAYLACSGSKVICSVHGPYARVGSGAVFSSTGQLECDIKFASSAAVSEKDSPLQPQLVVDALKSCLRLEKYAKMTISISIVVLEAQGCELAHAICCASLALLNSGIEMLDVVCASTAVKERDGNIIFDPTRRQISCGESCATVATIPSEGSITQICLSGKDDSVNALCIIQKCCERNLNLRNSFREKILDLSK